jgi:hypothetical protein
MTLVERYGAILSPKLLEKLCTATFSVLETHLFEDEHLTEILKEVGGYPVEWTSRPCFVWEHPDR